MAFLSERVRFGMKAKRNSQQVRRETRRASPRLWHSDVPGPFWNGTRRVGVSQIKAYCRTLAREFHPRKIILFGSYAYGTPTKDSDVDLLVIMPHRGRSVDQVVNIGTRIPAPFPMDLLVETPAYVRRRLALGCSFMKEVFTRGKVMYETADA